MLTDEQRKRAIEASVRLAERYREQGMDTTDAILSALGRVHMEQGEDETLVLWFKVGAAHMLSGLDTLPLWMMQRLARTHEQEMAKFCAKAGRTLETPDLCDETLRALIERMLP